MYHVLTCKYFFQGVQNQKVCVRSGIRTHARIRGPEHPLAFAGKDFLESGALDHSAILTSGVQTNFPCIGLVINLHHVYNNSRDLGF